MTQDELKDVPFVILGNKIDLPGAASPEEIKNAFGLHAMCTGQVRTLIHPPPTMRG